MDQVTGKGRGKHREPLRVDAWLDRLIAVSITFSQSRVYDVITFDGNVSLGTE